MLMLIGTCFPQVAAGLLVLGNGESDHELHCRLDDGRVEITLHHRRDLVSVAGSVDSHRHSLIEELLIGRCVSNDEPDHFLGFDRQSVLVDEDESRIQESGSLACFEPVGSDVIVVDSDWIGSPVLGCREEIPGGLSPPQVMRRGVVMRL
ncbi:hypothetical protein [Haloferula sp.]|uniref:hypothetical protein n=1 Tax=Haloferula sp. TaxID=2497595 RepID=UPI003C73033B